MFGDPMKEFLGMTNPGQHRKTRFDKAALIPSAFGTQFEVAECVKDLKQLRSSL